MFSPELWPETVVLGRNRCLRQEILRQELALQCTVLICSLCRIKIPKEKKWLFDFIQIVPEIGCSRRKYNAVACLTHCSCIVLTQTEYKNVDFRIHGPRRTLVASSDGQALLGHRA